MKLLPKGRFGSEQAYTGNGVMFARTKEAFRKLHPRRVKTWVSGVGADAAHALRRFSLGMAVRLRGLDAVIEGFAKRRYSSRDPIWFFETHVLPAGPEAAARFVAVVLSNGPRIKLYDALLLQHREDYDAAGTLRAHSADILRAAIDTQTPLLILRLINVARALECDDLVLDANMELKNHTDITRRSQALRKTLKLQKCREILPLSARIGDDLAELTHHLRERQQSRKRLVVTDMKPDHSMVLRLVRDAEEVVFINILDLYGRGDIDVGDSEAKVTVEHIRSRLHRFSEGYRDAHRRTKKMAARLADLFIEERVLEPFFMGTTGWKPYLTLELADALFFRCLRLQALQNLVESDEFDDIVLCFGDDQDLFRCLGALPILHTDHRLRITSIARSSEALEKYEGRVLSLLERMRRPSWKLHGFVDSLYGRLTKSDIERQAAAADADRIAARLSLSSDKAFGPSDRAGNYRGAPIIVGNDAGAYYSTFIPTLTRLLSDRLMVTAWQGASVTKLRQDLHAALGSTRSYESARLTVHDLPLRKAVPTDDAKKWEALTLVRLAPQLDALFDEIREDVALHYSFAEAAMTIFNQNLLFFGALARGYLTILKKWQPPIAILYSARAPRLALLANAARQQGVPSLTVEPHALNANYCRYARVPTDYIALPGPYFVKEYGAHYGLPEARCLSTGSPRFSLPKGFSLTLARNEARSHLEFSGKIVTYMGQPLDRTYSMTIWTRLLEAVKKTNADVTLVLKAHPEESPDQRRAYEETAADSGVKVIVVDRDAKSLIAASDLVVSCYSATLLEAAIIGVPTAVLRLEGEVYPMAYDEIIGCPVLESVEDISSMLGRVVSEDTSLEYAASSFKDSNPQFYEDKALDLLAEAIDRIILEGRAGVVDNPEFMDDPFLALHDEQTAPTRA